MFQDVAIRTVQQWQDTEGRIFMNNIKIADAFANGKAFIPFITCGDPNLETTKEVVHAAVEAGANLIELGIPFSIASTTAFALFTPSMYSFSGTES